MRPDAAHRNHRQVPKSETENMTRSKKSEKAPPKPPTEAQQPRRGFLLKLWVFLGSIALAEVVWLVVSFLRPRKPRARTGDFGTVIEAGPVEVFKPDSVTAFPRGHFYLACLADGGFLAISRRCTHLGCTVPWYADQKRFVCPCHASVFDIRGDVIHSPAPRALDIFEIQIKNNIVKVDTARRIERSQFRQDQVTHANKLSHG
jgi:cytochrome b6-f complex iron-sulfur subunit